MVSENQISVPISKVLLGCTCACSYVPYGCFCTAVAKPKIFTPWPFKNKFADPWNRLTNNIRVIFPGKEKIVVTRVKMLSV